MTRLVIRSELSSGEWKMSLKFFSQFLLVEEIVSDEQLDKAVSAAGVKHRTLGQLAVDA